MNADTGVEVTSMINPSVGTQVNLPAGSYELLVFSWSGTGAYKLDIYEQPPPQVFNVDLPASVSDGVPAAGAGNLETTVSEDVYAFSTASKKAFRIELWACNNTRGSVLHPTWKLVDAASGMTVKNDIGCGPNTVPDLPAGSYRLEVTSPGDTGTYKLRLAPRDATPISLPASVSDGVPAAGAGNLESPVAEDVYSFSTAADGSIQLDFSLCQPALQWRLVNADTGAEVTWVRNTCSGTLVNLPAGNYELYVFSWSGTGTYKLDVYKP